MKPHWFGFCGGFLRFYRSGEAFADATATVPARQWRHVAASYDGKQVKFYVDGQPAKQRQKDVDARWTRGTRRCITATRTM